MPNRRWKSTSLRTTDRSASAARPAERLHGVMMTISSPDWCAPRLSEAGFVDLATASGPLLLLSRTRGLTTDSREKAWQTNDAKRYRRRRSTAMDRVEMTFPFGQGLSHSHGVAHDLLLCGVGARQLARDAALIHYQYAVTDREHFGEVGRNH